MGLAGLVGGIIFAISCSLINLPGKTNVVLIIIDTIRPDRLGCYGCTLPTSPNIDKLASEGTLFTNAVTTAPITLPSVSAILTSTYPVSNNVRYNGRFFLSDANITLAEILKQQGYKTAAFIGGFPLDSRFKVDQGFDVYDDDFSNSAKQGNRKWIGHEVGDFERTAAEVNENTFKWLEQKGDDPFFLMVHYFDPHWPHKSPGDFGEKFKSPYNNEVAYTDEQIGKLLKKLDDMGLMKDTFVVLTGDHGEGLGAHEELTHGEYIFDTTVLIPLVLYHQNRIPKGRKIDMMVRSIDIMPTILELLNVPASPESQGVSLLQAFTGELEESPALIETMLPYYESADRGTTPAKVMGLRTGRWKLVYATFERDGKPVQIGELYDIQEDPLEIFNVLDENLETFVRLAQEMHSMIATYSAVGTPKNNEMVMDKETREKLKSLGYLK